MRITLTLAAAALLAACAKKDDNATPAADTSAAAPAPAAATASDAADPDRATGGGGVPAGYVGRTDRAGQNIAGAKYVVNGGAWDVTTGPAHIIYAAKDSARGTYTATATIEQLEAPRHPEAYGIFIGGQNLDQPSERYTYFVVRGGGEYLVRVRDGDQTKTISDWKASDAIPKADASGKATYRLKAHVAPDTVHFYVNDKLVTAVPKSAVTTDGIAGERINHNLHVRVEPVKITKG